MFSLLNDYFLIWLFCRWSRCINVSSSSIARGNGFTHRHERLASPVISGLWMEDQVWCEDVVASFEGWNVRAAVLKFCFEFGESVVRVIRASRGQGSL